MPQNSYFFRLPNLWTQIRDIRESVVQLLSNYEDDLKNGAAVMVSELVENAIKYGMSVPDMPEAIVEIRTVGNTLEIRVSNGISSSGSLDRLKSHLAQLETRDPMEVFLERLTILAHGQAESTGLGIYRAAAEGEFVLKLEEEGNVMTVVAQRPLRNGA